MPKRPKNIPALKHGAYSGLTLLPGENRVEFERLRRDLFAELKPQGRLEEDIVADIARLMWRKRNLGNYELTQLTRIVADIVTTARNIASAKAEGDDVVSSIDHYKGILEAKDEVEQRTAEEVEGENVLKEYDLRKMATLEGLIRELDVEERLGAVIDKCLKRLLFVRGLKSLDRSNEEARMRPARLNSA